MSETIQMIQRLAYVKGYEVSVEHAKRQCVLSGHQLMQLAFDFATIFSSKTCKAVLCLMPTRE